MTGFHHQDSPQGRQLLFRLFLERLEPSLDSLTWLQLSNSSGLFHFLCGLALDKKLSAVENTTPEVDDAIQSEPEIGPSIQVAPEG